MKAWFTKHYFIATCALLSPLIVHTYDNMHFYRATNRFEEPRFERTLLTSFDLSIGGGSTHKARNKDHETVPILDIYGTHNMQQLGVNVPNKDFSTAPDVILKDLSLIPGRNNFATLSINGKFSIVEANIAYTQNVAAGFFVQAHVPIRRLKIDNLCFTDLSPTDDTCPNVNTPIWQAFLLNFDAILQKHGLSREPFKETGVGDLTLSVGWTHNYQETEVLDFIDATFKFGVLIPTAKKRDENKVFSLPLGYNGHVGVPLSADLSFGAFEWLTIGTHLEAIIFANQTRKIRVKTAENQSGLIKLAQGNMDIDKGIIWAAGAFIKADHFVRGFSLYFGYSFAHQNKDHLTPLDTTTFDTLIINSDEMLKGWKMHTIHLFAEYDFTKEHMRFGPRIGVFYNRPVGGKRIFNTDVGGGTFGLEIAWDV